MRSSSGPIPWSGESAPVEDVVAAAEVAGLLDRDDVVRLLDDADRPLAARGVRAVGAHLPVGHRVADRAGADAVEERRDRLREPGGVLPRAPQEVEGDPLGRLRPDPGELPQLVDQARDGGRVVHRRSPSVASTPAPRACLGAANAYLDARTRSQRDEETRVERPAPARGTPGRGPARRALRDRRTPRRGRDGRGLPGPRRAPRARRGGQGPARLALRRRGAPAALRAGGARGRRPQPPEHPRRARRGHARRRALPRHGAARGRDPARAARRGAAARAPGGRDRGARSRPGSPRPTTRASSTGTSSPRTSS